MNEHILKSVLEQKYAEEFDTYHAIHFHIFSIKHKKSMKKILSRTYSKEKPSYKKVSKRFIITAITIILLAVLSITAVAIAFVGFILKEHSDNTELFAINYNNAPYEIEDVYHLSELPNGYELYSTSKTQSSNITIYYNQSEDKYIILSQYTKNNYNIHIDNEQGQVIDTYINGYVGLYYTNIAGTSILIWDDKDYIFEMTGDLSKIDIEFLAKSIKL